MIASRLRGEKLAGAQAELQVLTRNAYENIECALSLGMIRVTMFAHRSCFMELME